VETTICASQANLTVRAGTGLSSVVATLARDEGEAANVQVLLLGLARVLRPVRAIEGSRSSAANGATGTGSSVVEGNLATVLPVSVLIGAEKRVAGHGALVIGASLVASGSRGSTSLLSSDQVNSTREVLLAVDAGARVIADRRFATVARVTIAILEAVDASELASTNGASGNNLLTTTAVDGLGVINVETTIKVHAIELSGLERVRDVELGTSVAKSSLATVSGLLESPIPTDLGVVIDASAQLDLTTVTRVTVAILIAKFALIVASTRAVRTTDAIDREISGSLNVELELVLEVVVETLKVGHVHTFSLGRIIDPAVGVRPHDRIDAAKRVAPSTLSRVWANSDVVGIATVSANSLTNVER